VDNQIPAEMNPRFYFDTGAGLCLLLNSDFIRDSALLYPDKKPLPTQAQYGWKTNMQVTILKEFKWAPTVSGIANPYF
jgi:hypothetical protein